MMRGLLACATAIVLLAPLATAQDSLEISFEGGDREMTPGQPTSIPVEVVADCALILTAGEAGSLSVEIGHNLPLVWSVDTPSITLSPDEGCITNMGTQNGTGTLRVTPDSDAPGLEPVDLVLNATAGESTAQSDDSARLYVAYEPGHSISTDLSFPYAMTNADGDTLGFNITIQVQANAATMVSFTEVQSGGGSIAGLDSQTLDVPAGETSRTIPVTWTPPASWDNATISFRHSSSCTATGFECDPTNNRTEEWTITNEQSNGGGKSSPGLAPIVIVGLVALAARAARR